MSSFESMSVYLAPAHYTLHTPVMSQRNYPCDNVILEYFGNQNENLTGTLPFQKQLYQCMMGQALEMKSNIENRRSGNAFGTVIWQLGEIWPTGGWGSLEYATPVQGQVLGGRWKPLHYFLMNSLFADVIATCGTNANCYIKNDGVAVFYGSVSISAINLQNGKVSQVYTNSLTLAPGAGVMTWFCLSGTSSCSTYETILSKYGCTTTTCVLNVVVYSNMTSAVISHHVLALAPPVNLTLSSTSISFAVAPNSLGGADITLTTTGGVAAYAVLTTLAHGRFSDNAMFLLPGSTVVQFIPFGSLQLSQLTSTLRVECAQTYL